MFTLGVFFEAAGVSLQRFSAALSVFRVQLFWKKRPTSSAFLTADQWQASSEICRFHNNKKKMEKVPVDRRRCESTFSFPLTSKANARANFVLFLDISAAHSARLLLQLLLWQQKTLSAAICNRRGQLCFSLKKRSSTFSSQKRRQVWT